MISNAHIRLLRDRLESNQIDPTTIADDIAMLTDQGHTLHQLIQVTEEQARLAQQVIDTGEPYLAHTAEGDVEITPEDAVDYLNEGLRIYLGLQYEAHHEQDFRHVGNPALVELLEEYRARLTEEEPLEEEIEEADNTQEAIATINSLAERLFDVAHNEELRSLVEALRAVTTSQLVTQVYDRFGAIVSEVTGHTLGISNQWWTTALDGIHAAYDGVSQMEFLNSMETIIEYGQMLLRLAEEAAEQQDGQEEWVEVENSVTRAHRTVFDGLTAEQIRQTKQAILALTDSDFQRIIDNITDGATRLRAPMNFEGIREVVIARLLAVTAEVFGTPITTLNLSMTAHAVSRMPTPTDAREQELNETLAELILEEEVPAVKTARRPRKIILKGW